MSEVLRDLVVSLSLDLGNNYATTESAIMDMATRLAAAGSQVGLTQAQILGFATALSSVGLEAQAGGTAFSKAMIEMQVAAETNGKSLKDFARVAGLTTEEFKALWNSDPAGAMDETLALPLVIHHMVAPDAQLHSFLGEPEVRKHDVLLFVISWREHQHHGRKVRSGRKVKPGIAGTAFQFILIDSAAAFIPFVHRHPADRLLDPLIQTQLTEHVLISGRLLGLSEGIPHLIDGDRLIQRGVGFVPVALIRPVGVIRQAVEHGVEARIILPAFDDVQGFLMNLPADAVPVGASRCQQEPKRLLPGIAAALGHDIISRKR